MSETPNEPVADDPSSPAPTSGPHPPAPPPPSPDSPPPPPNPYRPGPQPPPPGAAPPPGFQPWPAGPGPYGAPGVGPPRPDERTMAMLIHLSGIFTGFVGPLVIWLIKKDESPFVDRHGKSALNFFITLAIAAFVSAILIIVLIGILLLLAVMVIGIVFPIIAAMKANNGEEYTYPMSIKFLS